MNLAFLRSSSPISFLHESGHTLPLPLPFRSFHQRPPVGKGDDVLDSASSSFQSDASTHPLPRHRRRRRMPVLRASPPLPPRPLHVLADDGSRNRPRRPRHLHLFHDLAKPPRESCSRCCSAAGELRVMMNICLLLRVMPWYLSLVLIDASHFC
ncbi:unnamed protein product [Triticum turgidum subsp. durum]|uniref:Uncharacterized protein n=1 Tax=Triticum turgidum subsp. durum TaxID=4567 RepID=A0A9R0TB10_TRITD|nr:unnamed protein product [Triticum turgidum subsp. durum]